MKKINMLFFTFLVPIVFSLTSYAMTPIVRKCAISNVSSTATASCYHASNRWFIIGFENGDTIAYDCHTGKKKKTLYHGATSVTTITISNDESLIAIGASADDGQEDGEIIFLKRNNQGEYLCADTIPVDVGFGLISEILIPNDNKSCLIQCNLSMVFIDLEYFLSRTFPIDDEALAQYINVLELEEDRFIYLQENGNLSKPSNKCLTFFIEGRAIAAYQRTSDFCIDEDGDEDHFRLLETPVYDGFSDLTPHRPEPMAFFMETTSGRKILLISSRYRRNKMNQSRCGFQTFVLNPEEERFEEVVKKDIPARFQKNSHLSNDHGWATSPYRLNDHYYILASVTYDGFKLELFDTYKCYSISEYYLKAKELGKFCHAYSAKNKYFFYFLQEDGSLNIFTFNFIPKKRYNRLPWRPIGKKKGASKNNALKRFVLKDRENAEPYLEQLCERERFELKELEADINEANRDNEDEDDNDSSDGEGSDDTERFIIHGIENHEDDNDSQDNSGSDDDDDSDN